MNWDSLGVGENFPSPDISWVKTLVNREKELGYYDVNFETKDLTTGIYFAKFEAGDYKEVKKLILIK